MPNEGDGLGGGGRGRRRRGGRDRADHTNESNISLEDIYGAARKSEVSALVGGSAAGSRTVWLAG